MLKVKPFTKKDFKDNNIKKVKYKNGTYTIIMKKVVTILAVIALTSCTKTWVCTIETTSELGTSSYEYEFKGTKDEMKDFEEQGNKDYPSLNMSQTTNCK